MEEETKEELLDKICDMYNKLLINLNKLQKHLEKDNV